MRAEQPVPKGGRPGVPAARRVENGPRTGRGRGRRPGGHPAGHRRARAAPGGGPRRLLPPRPVPGPPQVGDRRQHQQLEARLLPPPVARLAAPQLPQPRQPVLRHHPLPQQRPPLRRRLRRPCRLQERFLGMHLHRAPARRGGTVRPQRARLADRPKVERLAPVFLRAEPRRGLTAGAGHGLLLQVDHKGALREAALVVALLRHFGHQLSPGVRERLPCLAPAIGAVAHALATVCPVVASTRSTCASASVASPAEPGRTSASRISWLSTSTATLALCPVNRLLWLLRPWRCSGSVAEGIRAGAVPSLIAAFTPPAPSGVSTTSWSSN